LAAGYMTLSGFFDDYFVTNWALHIGSSTGSGGLDATRGFSPLINLRSSLTENTLFWILSSFSVFYIFFNRETGHDKRMVAFISAFLLFSISLVYYPHKQYFLSAVPLLCISAAYYLQTAFERFKTKEIYRALLIILIIILPVYYMVNISKKSNVGQLATVKYVVQKTDDSDLVYDGDIKYNLFRRDLHYFWYQAGRPKMLKSLSSRLQKHGDYDICRLIEAKRPKFMLAFGLPDEGCQGLGRVYKETRYPGLYIKTH